MVVQVAPACPGTYYLRLEARTQLRDLGITLTMGDSQYLR